MPNAKDAQASDVDLWFPFFIGDYLSDTMHLTTEEHGAYMLLIMAYWKNGGPLADKQNSLCSITRLHGDAWSNAQAVLEEFFSIENGFWIHSRIDEELKKARALKAKKVEKARKAAAARWKKHEKCSDDAQGYAQALLEDVLEECPSPSPSPIDTASSHEDAVSEHSPPTAANCDEFPMNAGWSPGADFDDKCRMASIDLKRANQDRVAILLGEFKNYWITNPGRIMRQNRWEHALLQRVIREHSRGSLYEKCNGIGGGSGEIDWSDTSWIEDLSEGSGPPGQ